MKAKLLAATLLLSFAPLALAGNDLRYATDPVGTLNLMTKQVASRAHELEAIADDLDKVSKEIDEFEKLPAKSVSQAKFALLDKKFKATISESEALEKKARSEFGQNLKKIAEVRACLDSIAADRKSGKKPVTNLTDSEIKDCRKNLDELEKTVIELSRAVDDKGDEKVEAKPAAKVAKPVAKTKAPATPGNAKAK